MGRYRTRLTVLAALLAAMAVPVWAAPAIDIATYKGADREQLLLAGARKEGKVAFYSGMIENQALRPLVEAFKKKYPFLAVEYWRGDSRGLVQKTLTERRANRVIGDIVESTGGAEVLIKAGAVQAFSSPASAMYPAAYVDKNFMWAASRLNYFGVAYNTRQVSAADVPKSYQDLLNPKWRGQIAWRADSEVGAGLFIASVLQSMGKAAGEAYLQKLSAQRIVNYAGSARALVDRVGEGEYRLALEIYAHHPLISKAKGAPLDTQMLNPATSSLSTIQLVKGAPHPHAAMLMIDFVLSKEGQETLRAAQYLSPNPNVAPDPSLTKIIPRLAGFKETVITPELMFASRNESNALFQKYFR
ncbi:MAG: extracellular solute-binding protein [Alphaproteobacteria bacterium]|nr:extracellular solute-binding protein [Alphaproteobacteria bacterium]